MPPSEAIALRVDSRHTLISRWKPVDLVCRRGDEEFVVRTKLVRSKLSAAVCAAEAISHATLSALGFRMAEPFTVLVDDEFARDLTAHYEFENHVQSGKHWGTRLMRRGVQEVKFSSEYVEFLEYPPDLFRLYLADVVLGNRDRATHGNVLLRSNETHSNKFDLIPIDQSDAFFHPSTMIRPAELRSRFNETGAELLDGTESVLIDYGPKMVRDCFAGMETLRDRANEFILACHDEWINRADTDADALGGFLDHRIENLAELARQEHWMGIASIDPGGQYVLDLP